MSNNQYIPKNLYQDIIKNIPIACVDVAIIAKGSVLLVKRKDQPAKDCWWVPGGRVYKNEMMHKTAERKCLEEVGINCHIGPIVHTAETIFPDGPYCIPVHSINSCFLAYPKNNNFNPMHDVKINEHHTEFFWLKKIAKKSSWACPVVCHIS